MGSQAIPQAVRRQKGFSLIEVSVSLAVLGILLASATPRLNNWLANAHLRNTAESMQEGLQKARAEALRRNQSVTFWLMSTPDPKVLSNDCTKSATGGAWVVSVSDPTAKCLAQTVAARPLGDGGDGVAVSARRRDGSTEASSITFNALGQVAGGDAIGIISVSDRQHAKDHRRYRVMVSSSGRALVCDEGVTNARDPRMCPAA